MHTEIFCQCVSCSAENPFSGAVAPEVGGLEGSRELEGRGLAASRRVRPEIDTPPVAFMHAPGPNSKQGGGQANNAPRPPLARPWPCLHRLFPFPAAQRAPAGQPERERNRDGIKTRSRANCHGSAKIADLAAEFSSRNERTCCTPKGKELNCGLNQARRLSGCES